MTSQLLINEPPLQVLPTLAQKVGLNEAIVLQQVHYWLAPRVNKNFFEGRHWVRNTYEQWQSQFPFWGKRTIRRTFVNLVEAGILVSFVSKDLRRFKYYTLDYEKLEAFVKSAEEITLKSIENEASRPTGQFGHIEVAKMSDRSGQSGQMHVANLATSIYMDSETTNSENTLPPLSPPSNISSLSSIKEEEEEKVQVAWKQFNNNFSRSEIEMLEIWNQTVQKKIHLGKDVHLTEKRAKMMKNLLETVLCEEAITWQDYCALIANSRYLSGGNPSGFKVTIDWALVPDNAYKILEGAIYDKLPSTQQETKTVSWQEFTEQLVRTLPTNKFLLPWVKISINLAKQLGQIKYKSWFSKVYLTDLSDTNATLAVQGQFMKCYIIQHFSSELLVAIQSLYPSITSVDYHVYQPNEGNL